MVEFEADDAIGAAALKFADAPGVERVVILSPDKDMTQCVREDGRVVCFDRRKGLLIDADAVRAKFGVSPASIPDYLALVGDSADGYPGIPGWGAKSAAAVLARYEHLEAIPERASQWDVSVRGALNLAANLRDTRDDAFLFRELATLRADAPDPRDARRPALARRAPRAVRGAHRGHRRRASPRPRSPLGPGRSLRGRGSVCYSRSRCSGRGALGPVQLDELVASGRRSGWLCQSRPDPSRSR